MCLIRLIEKRNINVKKDTDQFKSDFSKPNDKDDFEILINECN